MKFFILSFSIAFSAVSYCQIKNIPVTQIEQRRIKSYTVLSDSTIIEYDTAPIEVNNFEIIFTKALFHVSKNELELAGKVCFLKREPCSGLPNVELFKMKKSKRNFLETLELIDRTNTKKNIGEFHVKFTLEDEEILIFYMSDFFIEQYKLRGLFF
jgi:hypothetical protein